MTDPAVPPAPVDALEPDADTFPKLLLRNAVRFAARDALREKHLGIWQAHTWARYHDRVRDFALGLEALGLARGDKVAIVGDNRPEWVIAELAAQAVGAASVGIYQDSNLTEVAYVIDHCDATVVVAEDQEQVDKILGMLDGLPKVRHVVYWDARGLRNYDHPALLSFADVEARGRAVADGRPQHWQALVAAGHADDLAIISYTSGTTGSPKGAMLTFRNLLVMVSAVQAVDPKRSGDEFVSFLPLAWIGEQMVSVSQSLLIGFTINFPEEPDTVMADLREIGPHTMFAPPRIWENIHASVQVRIMDTSPFKRFMYGLCMPAGYRVADLRFAQKPVPLLWRIAHALAWVGLFRALRDRLGLSRIRSCSTGGAALGPDVFRFFHAIGVPLRQIYGQTEISGISCMHRGEEIRFHTVGRPIPGTEVRISPDGEIQSRSAAIFRGYYKNDAATAEAVTDGWLRSGDAGYLTDEGQLVVIDRVKDVMQLADGTRFSPQFIENRLKFSPYVKEAVVVGKERPYVSAMLCIDLATVGKWAEQRKLSYTTYTDISARAEVYDLVQAEVERVNQTLPAAASIRRFVLLYKELDADDEELTRTRKVRRGFVEERYADVVASLYSDRDQVPIDTEIRFQDGRSARIRTTLAIRTLSVGAPAAASERAA